MTIAVTGPLASGKSTFVELLDELGAETVSADDMVHHLLAEDDETITRVTERFGEEVRGQIPLLFEGGGEERFDLTVTVTSPEERRRAWAEERGMEEQQRRAIEDRQFSQEEKARRADVVVENDGDLDRLREQARILVDWVLRERGSGEGGVEED